jgi:hypothetical protein
MTRSCTSKTVPVTLTFEFWECDLASEVTSCHNLSKTSLRDESSSDIEVGCYVKIRKFYYYYYYHYYYIITYYYWWGETESTWYCGHYWPVIPDTDDRWWWSWSNWWNEDWRGKLKYSEKTCPRTTLSTTNPTWPEPGSNRGRRCGKSATNRLSYGAAIYLEVTSVFLETIVTKIAI